MPKTISKTSEKRPVIIELKNIYKSYGKLEVLKNVSTKIYKGDRIGIIGPNGQGKSTIAEIILRVKKPTKGTVVYANPKMTVGVQFQESNYPRSLRVISMIKYYVDAYKLNKEEIELEKLIDYFELRPYLKKYINSLSGGQKQRLNIMLSIMHNPELIILDELTTGLDIEVRDRMKYIIHNKILARKETSLLLVSHNMPEVEELCNRI
jgi:ABC-2 type transport system ATP-binding protein